MLCASFVVQNNIGMGFVQALYYKIILGSALYKLYNTKIMLGNLYKFLRNILIFWVDTIKNEAILRNVLWKIKCRTNDFVPMHFAIFSNPSI